MVDRLTFPQSAYFRRDFARHTLGDMFNRMGAQQNGIIVAREVLTRTGLSIGDPLNLDLLLTHGAHVWLRCPLVPGVNDSPEHLRAIAELGQRYPQIERIEIMAYHNIGNDKYDRYELANPLPSIPSCCSHGSRRSNGINLA